MKLPAAEILFNIRGSWMKPGFYRTKLFLVKLSGIHWNFAIVVFESFADGSGIVYLETYMKRIWRMLNLIYNMLMRIFSILHVNDEFNTLIHVNFAVLYQILRNLKKQHLKQVSMSMSSFEK